MLIPRNASGQIHHGLYQQQMRSKLARNSTHFDFHRIDISPLLDSLRCFSGVGAWLSFGRCALTGWDPIRSAWRGLGSFDRGRLLREDLASFHQSALLVLASVHKVRVVESQLDGAIQNVVGGFNTQHERVVLVTNLRAVSFCIQIWNHRC